MSGKRMKNVTMTTNYKYKLSIGTARCNLQEVHVEHLSSRMTALLITF
jgi:hypothetical protein